VGDSTEILELRDTVEGLTTELFEVRRQYEAAEAEGAAAGAARLRLEGELADALARLARLETELMRLARFEADFKASQAEIAAIRSSQTWKIGRFFMAPVRLVRGRRGHSV
jgi:hypothetical protein